MFSYYTLFVVFAVIIVIHSNTAQSHGKFLCECGISKFNANSCRSHPRRKLVADAELPWHVSIMHCKQNDCRRICSGIIVGKRHVLTSATCIHEHQVLDLKVIVGFVNEYLKPFYSVTHDVIAAMLHPNWDIAEGESDIALVRLEQDIDFTHEVKPLCLPLYSNDTYSHFSAAVSGWGKPVEGLIRISFPLQRVGLIIEENKNIACMRANAFKGIIPQHFICITYDDPFVCGLENGAPLFVNDKNRCILIGLVSNRKGCFGKEFIRFFTRISAYLDWIYDNAFDDECLSKKRRHAI